MLLSYIKLCCDAQELQRKGKSSGTWSSRQCKLFSIQEPVKSFSIFRGIFKSLYEINWFF